MEAQLGAFNGCYFRPPSGTVCDISTCGIRPSTDPSHKQHPHRCKIQSHHQLQSSSPHHHHNRRINTPSDADAAAISTTSATKRPGTGSYVITAPQSTTTSAPTRRCAASDTELWICGRMGPRMDECTTARPLTRRKSRTGRHEHTTTQSPDATTGTRGVGQRRYNNTVIRPTEPLDRQLVASISDKLHRHCQRRTHKHSVYRYSSPEGSTFLQHNDTYTISTKLNSAASHTGQPSHVRRWVSTFYISCQILSRVSHAGPSST
jgi:hypothetical protein